MRKVRLPILFLFPLCLSGFATEARLRMAHIGLELDGSWSWIREVFLNPSTQLVAIADPHPELLDRARAAAPTGTSILADYRQMLDTIHPEAVTVTVPNSRHLEIVRECARRRIHVWFQKPMASTGADAREMERLAREAGIVLMISYHTQWSAAYRAMNARIAAGAVGHIRRVEVHHAFSASKVLSPYYEKQFLDPSLHGGGALMDQGTYGICYAVWLLGKPTRVYATGRTIKPRPGLTREDESWVVLDYPNATAVISGGWWTEPDGPGVGFARVSGTKGELLRDLDRVTFTPASTGQRAEAQVVPLPHVPPDQRGGIAHFLDCIRTQKPVDSPHSPRVNVLVNEIVDAAYESMASGRAVHLR